MFKIWYTVFSSQAPIEGAQFRCIMRTLTHTKMSKIKTLEVWFAVLHDNIEFNMGLKNRYTTL